MDLDIKLGKELVENVSLPLRLTLLVDTEACKFRLLYVKTHRSHLIRNPLRAQ